MAELEIHHPDGLVSFKALDRERPLIVGAASGCDVQIEAPGASRKHFAVRWSGSQNSWRFDVNKEAEGVLHNGVASMGDVFSPDDELALGGYSFTFKGISDRAVPESATAAVPAYMPPNMPAQFADEEYYTPLWKRKSVQIVALALLVLGIAATVVYTGYHQTMAGKMFNDAMKDYDSGTAHEKALIGFKNYRESYPNDERRDKGEIYEGLAKANGLMQSGQQWEAALLEVEDVIKKHDRTEAYKEATTVEAIMKVLLDVAKGAGDRAKDTRSRLDRDALRVAKKALETVDRMGTREGELAVKYDTYTKLAETAGLAIEKESERRGAVERMNEGLKAKKPMVVYEEHRKLYGRYPDLRADSESQGARAQARKMEQELTVFTPLNEAAPAVAAAPPAPARPPVRRTVLGDAKPAGKVVVVQAADTAFGVDVGSGEVKWQEPVGFNPAFSPKTTEAGVLIHRTLDQTLMLVNPADGKPIWTTPLGKRMLRYISRPLEYQGRIYVAGFEDKNEANGKLFVFALDGGRPVGTYSFPQPLAGMPVLDTKRRQLLLPGNQATLYVINPNNNQCVSVQSIGHEAGTLAWVPLFAGRYIFTVEKVSPEKSTLRVFVFSGEDGVLREKPIGEIGDLPGQVQRDPVLQGTRLFITTDRDAFLAFDLSAEDDEKPVARAARFVPPSIAKGAEDAPFALSPVERNLWTIGKKVKFFEIRAGVPEPRRIWERNLVGPPAMTPFFEGDTLVIGSRSVDQGSVQILAVDAATQKEKWQLELVLPPKAVQLDPTKADTVVLQYESGATVTLPMAELAGAKPLELPAMKGERPLDPEPDFRDVAGFPRGTVQWSGVGGKELRYLAPGKPEARFELVSAAAASPARFGKGVLLPCSDGMVYWIDPQTGAELADPFGVPFAEGQPVDLGAAIAIDDTTAVALAGVMLSRLRLIEKPYAHFKEISRVEIPEAPDLATTDPGTLRYRTEHTQLAKVGASIVVATNRKLFRLRPDDLSVDKTMPLGGNCSDPPVLVGGLAVFRTDRRELVAMAAMDKNLADVKWRMTIDRPTLGPPQVSAQDGFWLAYPDGQIVEYAAADAKPKRTLQAHRPLIAGPYVFASNIVAITPVGSLVNLVAP